MLAGITSDAEASHILPDGTNAALTAPLGSGVAPTVVFRDELRDQAEALDSALATSLDGAWNDVEVGENAAALAPSPRLRAWSGADSAHWRSPTAYPVTKSPPA